MVCSGEYMIQTHEKQKQYRCNGEPIKKVMGGETRIPINRKCKI